MNIDFLLCLWYYVANMTETYTPAPAHQDNETNASFDDHFKEIEAMQAAQRIVDLAPTERSAPRPTEVTLPPEWSEQDPSVPAQKQERSKKIGKKLLSGALSAGLLIGGGAVLHEALKAPEFSEETTTYTVQPGDGLYDAAEQIEGIGSIDTRDAVDHIATDPANIDVLSDGLQAGESITIPVEVKK